MSSRLPLRGLPSQLAQHVCQQQQPSLAGSRSNVARHDLGLRRDCVGSPFRRPLHRLPPPVLCHQAVTHASPDPLVESPAPGALGGDDSPLHLPSPPLPPPPHPVPWYYCTGRNPTHPSINSALQQAAGNKPDRPDRQHPMPEQPYGCVRVKAPRPGDRVPYATPHAAPARSRYAIIIIYLPVYAVITVHVLICGSSAPRTRPAPDSHMYTTAQACEGGEGGVCWLRTRGVRSLWDFVRTFTTCPSPEKMQG